MYPHLFDFQNLSPDLGQIFPQPGYRCNKRLQNRPGSEECRKRSAINLAAGRERQGVQYDKAEGTMGSSSLRKARSCGTRLLIPFACRGLLALNVGA